MNRNKHIDKKNNHTFNCLFVLFIVAILVTTVRCFSLIADDISNLTILGLGALALIIVSIIKCRIELILLQKMKKSERFENLLLAYKFNEIHSDYYETTLNEYYVGMINHSKGSFQFDETDNGISLEMFCDCSKLSKEAISKIEEDSFIVTHISIGIFSSNWFFRFNPEKISKSIEKIYEIVCRYNLEIITKEDLKSNKFWE